VLLSLRRDGAAARRFFLRALRTLKVIPSEVVTDAAPVCPGVVGGLMSAGWHHVEQYANNPIESDRPPAQAPAGTNARTTDRSDRAGRDRWHAFLQNLRRGHYELAVDERPALRLAAAFAELARVI
jgi:transposase-like protein